MKKISVLGVNIKDMSVREAMRLVGQFFDNHKINVIYFLETGALLEVSTNADMRRYIESMDLVAVTSPDILKAAQINAKSRIKEVETAQLLRDLLLKLEREKASIFLLAETGEQIEILGKTLYNYARGLRIVGSYALENLPGDDDHAINEINAETPDILISQLPYPRHEQFIFENRMKVNSRIWIAFRDITAVKPIEGVKQNKLSRLVTKTLFKRIVSKYDRKNEE